MKSSDDLFQLIKSLTKSEKRYFKVIASKKQSSFKNNYLKLFEAIEKQKTYDEEKIIRQFTDNTFIKHLPSEKNYLYSLILKSLHIYHSSSSTETTLNELLHFSEILYSKGLYQQSRKIVTKAREISHANEMHSQMIKISRQRIELANQLSINSKELQTEHTSAISDSKLAIEQIVNLNSYYELHGQFFFLIRKEGELIRKPSELKKFDQIMLNPLMDNEKNALSHESKGVFYFIRSVYHYMKGDLQKAYHYNKKELEHIESHSKKNLKQSDYTAKLNNICEVCLRMKKDQEFWYYLNKLKKTPAISILEKSRQFYRYHDLILRMYMQTGEFEKAILLVNVIETGLETYKNHIHQSRIISIYYHIAYTYFGVGEYKKSLIWINRILNDRKPDLRRDLLCFARLLNFIIHFELNNIFLLEHIIKSTHHYLHTKEKLYDLETIVLKFLKKLSKVSMEEQVIGLLKELKNELVKLLKDPFEKRAFEYFDLISWVESKIEGRNFAEIVKSNVKLYS
jgi:hypothetical protein